MVGFQQLFSHLSPGPSVASKAQWRSAKVNGTKHLNMCIVSRPQTANLPNLEVLRLVWGVGRCGFVSVGADVKIRTFEGVCCI
jgi:hypothetical protein